MKETFTTPSEKTLQMFGKHFRETNHGETQPSENGCNHLSDNFRTKSSPEPGTDKPMSPTAKD